jgi:hypothetical protein
MPYPIEKKLVVAVSSRAVFAMDEANEVSPRVRILVAPIEPRTLGR